MAWLLVTLIILWAVLPAISAEPAKPDETPRELVQRLLRILVRAINPALWILFAFLTFRNC